MIELDATTRQTVEDSRELQVVEACFDDDELRHRLLTEPRAVLGSDRSVLAEVKRFAELLIGDQKFRAGLSEAPRETVQAHGLQLDPHAIRAMWDSKALREGRITAEDTQSEPIRMLNAFNEMKRGFFNRMRERRSINAAFDGWRRRQIERCSTEMDRNNARAIVHAPATFELASGCSVGCWFCGVSAERYRGAVSYEAIRPVWLDTIAALREVIGDAARNAFLYWGTEPFDNPDYERYCLDLKEVCGGFPQTTTAVPMRDPARTWELIKLSTLHGCIVNRFSIITPRLLQETMKTFDPLQMLFVEIVPQNRGSLLIKADAGKARDSKRLDDERAQMAAELAEFGSPAIQTAKPSTIACVSGFLFNLARKDVRLISPCTASEQWPDGFIVFDEATFADGPEALEVMRTMVARHMPQEPDAASLIAFRGDLSYGSLEHGFVLTNEYDTVRIQNTAHAHVMRRVGDLISSGRLTSAQIRRTLSSEFGIAEEQAGGVLNTLYRKGLLAERQPIERAVA